VGVVKQFSDEFLLKQEVIIVFCLWGAILPQPKKNLKTVFAQTTFLSPALFSGVARDKRRPTGILVRKLGFGNWEVTVNLDVETEVAYSLPKNSNSQFLSRITNQSPHKKMISSEPHLYNTSIQKFMELD
jgi:hypothetical protein